MGAAAEKLALLHEILADLGKRVDRRPLYERAAAGTRRLFGATVALSLSWDAGRRELVQESAAGAGDSAIADLAVCAGPAYASRSTVTLDDVEHHPRVGPVARRMGLGTIVATPLPGAGEAAPLGALCLGMPRGAAPFDDEDRRALELFARAAALAIASAELSAGAARRLARAEQLAVALRAIVESRAESLILERALDVSVSLLGADRAAIYLTDAHVNLEMAVGRGLSRSYLEAVARRYRQSAGGIVPLAQAPVYVADLQTDPRTRVMHELAAHEGVHTVLFVPMFGAGRVFGVLGLYHDLVWHYEPEDLVQARSLAEGLGAALANAGVYAAAVRQALRQTGLEAMTGALIDGAGVRAAVTALVDSGAAIAVWLYSASLELVAHAGASDDGAGAEALTLARAAQGGAAISRGARAAAPIGWGGSIVVALPLPPRVDVAWPMVTLQLIDSIDPAEPESLAVAAARLLGGRLVRAAWT